VDASLGCGTAIRNIAGEALSEATGQKGFNYRTEPVWARLGVPPETRIGTIPNLDLANLWSSAVHGDPATPLVKVGVFETLRVRLVHPSGHKRLHGFGLWGAEWPHNPWAEGSGSRVMGPNAKSFAIGMQGGIGPMTAWNINPFYRAGGKYSVPGDRLFLDSASVALSGGTWGLVRVTP
jgi:hypothetical protein